jgi:hypothetical protein
MWALVKSSGAAWEGVEKARRASKVVDALENNIWLMKKIKNWKNSTDNPTSTSLSGLTSTRKHSILWFQASTPKHSSLWFQASTPKHSSLWFQQTSASTPKHSSQSLHYVVNEERLKPENRSRRTVRSTFLTLLAQTSANPAYSTR